MGRRLYRSRSSPYEPKIPDAKNPAEAGFFNEIRADQQRRRYDGVDVVPGYSTSHPVSERQQRIPFITSFVARVVQALLEGFYPASLFDFDSVGSGSIARSTGFSVFGLCHAHSSLTS